MTPSSCCSSFGITSQYSSANFFLNPFFRDCFGNISLISAIIAVFWKISLDEILNFIVGYQSFEFPAQYLHLLVGFFLAFELFFLANGSFRTDLHPGQMAFRICTTSDI
uniref:DNA-directed RNA polymerase IV subunit 1 n=1 Tax=Rhizophora mucronata TaxID=61149 RepID=A0A2P2JM73_RHIMU